MTPDIPVPDPVGLEEGEVIMAESTRSDLHDQNMAGMGQAMTRFQNDAVTVSKATDYAYLQDKDLPSLVESLGAQQVMNRNTPGGPAPSTPVE